MRLTLRSVCRWAAAATSIAVITGACAPVTGGDVLAGYSSDRGVVVGYQRCESPGSLPTEAIIYRQREDREPPVMLWSGRLTQPVSVDGGFDLFKSYEYVAGSVTSFRDLDRLAGRTWVFVTLVGEGAFSFNIGNARTSPGKIQLEDGTFQTIEELQQAACSSRSAIHRFPEQTDGRSAS